MVEWALVFCFFHLDDDLRHGGSTQALSSFACYCLPLPTLDGPATEDSWQALEDIRFGTETRKSNYINDAQGRATQGLAIQGNKDGAQFRPV